MTLLLLTWLVTLGAAPQATQGLRLDIRVFDGTAEVTRDTIVSLYNSGSRVDPRRVPVAANGERQMTLPPGQYDLQLLHQDDGRVLGVRWTSLRLLVAYPGEHGQHLEVLNMRPGYGALQVRRAGTQPELGAVPWTATLRPAGGGSPVRESLRGDGYLLFVAPPGRYDLEVRPATGAPQVLREVEVREDLTYLRSW